MNVLILSHNPDLSEKELIKALSFSFNVYTAGELPQDLQVKGHLSLPLPLGRLDFRPTQHLVNWSQRIGINFDVALCFNSRFLLSAIFCKKLKVVRKVIAYRGTLGGASLLDPSAWFTFRSSALDKIICNCQAVATSLAQHGIAEKKLEIIYKGHKLDWYLKNETFEGTADFVSALNFRFSKGLFRLFGIFRDLSEYSLGIFGKVPAWARLLAPKNVKFFGFLKEPWRFYQNFRGFILLSGKEGVPKAVIEAVAKKLPVVSTSVGGLREVFSNDAIFFINDFKNREDLAELFKKIKVGESQLKEITEKAYSQASLRLSFDDYVARVINLISNS